MIGALIGTAVSGIVGASASKSAADTTADAYADAAEINAEVTREANAIAQQQYANALQMYQPQWQLGMDSQSALAYELGIGARPSYSNAPANTAAYPTATGSTGSAAASIPEITTSTSGGSAQDWSKYYAEKAKIDAFMASTGQSMNGSQRRALESLKPTGESSSGTTTYSVGDQSFSSMEEAEQYRNGLVQQSQAQDAGSTQYEGYGGYKQYTDGLADDYATTTNNLAKNFASGSGKLYAGYQQETADANTTFKNRTANLDAEYRAGYDALSSGEGFETSPGYEFRLQEGQDAIANTAAARGLRLSGDALKEALTYGEGQAAQEFDSWYGRGENKINNIYTAGYQNASDIQGQGTQRAGNLYNTGYNRLSDVFSSGTSLAGQNYTNNNNNYINYLNMLNGQAAQGQQATAGIVNAGQNYSSTAGGNLLSSGAAQSNAAIGAGNAAADGIMGANTAFQNTANNMLGLSVYNSMGLI